MDLSVRVAGSAITGGAVKLWGRMKDVYGPICLGSSLQTAEKNSLNEAQASQATEKTHALYQGTTSEAPEKLMLCVKARLHR
jgi:hypothetical protein